MSGKLPYDLKGASWVIEALVIGQLLATVVFCVSIGFALFGMQLLPGGMLQPLILGWQGITVGILIAVIFWVFRAAANGAVIAPDARWIRPWWTVVWWFVPVICLWQPVRAMSQIWNASVDGNADINGPAAPAVTTWWLLFLFGPVLAGIIAGVNLEVSYVVALIMLMQAASTAALMTIVRRVRAGQLEMASGRGHDPAGASMMQPSA